MNFLALSPDQQQYQSLAAQFANREIAPLARGFENSEELPSEVYRKVWDAGLANVQVPQDAGGLGLSTTDACIIAEEIGAACTGFGACLFGNAMAMAPVLVAGSSRQRKEFLGLLIEEPCLAAYAGNMSGAATVEARQVGDDYVLNGTQRFVLNGNSAMWYYVVGHAKQATVRLNGFIVPRYADGLVIEEREKTMGWKAADLCRLSFHDVVVPKEYRIGQEGQGLDIVRQALALSLPVVASSAVGLMRSCVRLASKYAKERETFGLPIARHQAIGFMLADMHVAEVQSRLLCRRSAWLAASPAASPADTYDTAAAAKIFAAHSATQVSEQAVQIYGGYGYSREYPIEKLMRDAKMFELYGNSELAVSAQRGMMRGSC